jgi:hypothetical protein
MALFTVQAGTNLVFEVGTVTVGAYTYKIYDYLRPGLDVILVSASVGSFQVIVDRRPRYYVKY